jgi:hypothetical protein
LPTTINHFFVVAAKPLFPKGSTVVFYMSEDKIKYPSGFGIKDVVAWGTTGLIVLDESSKTIIKTPLDSLDQERVHLILRKRQIYKRFAKCGGHKGILSYHGTFETGIRLEYAPNHNLHSLLLFRPRCQKLPSHAPLPNLALLTL